MTLYGSKRVPDQASTTVGFPAVAPSTGWSDPAPPPRRGGRLTGWLPEHRRRRLLVASATATVLIVAGGATAAYAYAGEVPRGTTVLGVDLGGMSRTEAVQTLRADLDRRADTLAAPVSVQVGEQSAQITPADVGLAVDVEATVAAAVRTRPNPFSLLFGSRTVKPVVTVDVERLDAELRKTASNVGQAMTMPAITFEGTTPKPVYPKPGKSLDAERSAQALRAGWLETQPVVVPLVDLHPPTTAEDVDRLMAELAVPAVAKPVTVTTDRGTFTIATSAIAQSLVLTADDAGKIDPRVDEAKLRAALTAQLSKIEVAPKDATIALDGGRPRVVASSAGSGLDMGTLSRDLLAVLSKADGREVKGVLRAVPPKTTTDDVSRLGIKERVSTFTTNFTGGAAAPRTQNIYQIAREVDGAVVKPGEAFSLNGHTGPRGYAEGYKDAPVILNGKLVPGVGGGASQFTTTLFNAAYYAGLEDVYHRPHSYWFSRYPSVIEATIFYPTLDLKFRNNTRYGVLIDTSFTASSVTVSIWSTRVYENVTTEWSARRNITKPPVVYLEPGPSCIATAGIDGFTQDAWRIFRQGGREIRREKFTWKYDPEPRYICGTQP